MAPTPSRKRKLEAKEAEEARQKRRDDQRALVVARQKAKAGGGAAAAASKPATPRRVVKAKKTPTPGRKATPKAAAAAKKPAREYESESEEDEALLSPTKRRKTDNTKSSSSTKKAPSSASASSKKAQKEKSAAAAASWGAALATVAMPAAPPARSTSRPAASRTTPQVARAQTRPSPSSTTTSTSVSGSRPSFQKKKKPKASPMNSPKPTHPARNATGRAGSALPVLPDEEDAAAPDPPDDEPLTATMEEDKGIGASWVEALLGFLLVVVFSFGVSGLYGQGHITGDFGGLKAVWQSRLAAQSENFVAWIHTTTDTAAATTLAPCFRDSPTENEKDYFESPPLDAHCVDVDTSLFIACPASAHCAGGVIEQCFGKHFAVAALTRDACLLTDQANATIAALVQQLEAWTVQDYCLWETCPHVVTSTATADTAAALDGNVDGRPLFDYGNLVQTLQVAPDIKLIEHANAAAPADQQVFVTGRSDDKFLVGLHPNQPFHPDFLCVTGHFFMALAGQLLFWASMVVYAVLGWLYEITFESYPLISTLFSVVGFLIVYLVSAKRKRAVKREILRANVVHARELALAALSHRRNVQVLGVRDGLSFQLYPSSHKERLEFNTVVWPFVVRDVRRDNRVLTTNAMSVGGGDARLMWKWTDASDPPLHVQFAADQ